MDHSHPSESPFVGGAEMARRNARKRMNQPNPHRHLICTKKVHKQHHRFCGSTAPPYPETMRTYDRFFGSLLSSTVESIKMSQFDADIHLKLMEHACSLLNVPSLPLPPLPSNKNRSIESRNDVKSDRLRQSCFNVLASDNSTMSTNSGTFDNPRNYYLSKTSLIVEETRFILSESLNDLMSKNRENLSISLQLISTDERYPQHSKIFHQCSPLLMNFQIENQFNSRKDMNWSRPGSVFILRPCRVEKTQTTNDNKSDLKSSLLACVAPTVRNGVQGSDINGRFTGSPSLSLLIFHRDETIILNQFTHQSSDSNDCNDREMPTFQAFFLTSLISQVRQMEACLRMVNVSFMSQLLGSKKSTHIRFNDSDEEKDVCCNHSTTSFRSYVTSEEEHDRFPGDGLTTGSVTNDEIESFITGLLPKLPVLNPTQERAASVFLNSPKSSIVLVQGPPGTGKSTFLVNVVFRRLLSDPKARLLVTAPTNKAVSVLANKFLEVVDNRTISTATFNAVLVGVEDKLISNQEDDHDFFSSDALSTSLKSIFVYTWLESVRGEFVTLLKKLEMFKKTNIQPTETAVKVSINRSSILHLKLLSRIPDMSHCCKYYSQLILEELKSAAATLHESSLASFLSLIDNSICHTKTLISLLDEIDSNDVAIELLSTSRVIFCTLSTAGSSILKRTRQVDDILVDEAAAATEPEICIPFHLSPKRMLSVGDPMQLPPTIMSRLASDLGLSKSMHERLMNQCNGEYTMLDHQYRMVPSISSFPSRQFYNGKIIDGQNVTSATYSSKSCVPIAKPYTFIHVQGKEYRAHCGSYANMEECTKILEIVEEMLHKSEGRISHDNLRIITFYKAQASLLNRLLARREILGVLVSTVDSSQGCEADTVIISFTRSNNKRGVIHAAGFLADDRRINVAMTRARHQLICVGNVSTLGSEGSDTLKQLVRDAAQRGCVVNAR